MANERLNPLGGGKIKQLEELLGGSSLSGIGDGTVTGAIKAINSFMHPTIHGFSDGQTAIDSIFAWATDQSTLGQNTYCAACNYRNDRPDIHGDLYGGQYFIIANKTSDQYAGLLAISYWSDRSGLLTATIANGEWTQRFKAVALK